MSESVLPGPEEAQWQYLVQAQPVVEQAKGILMERFHCGADVAWELLRGTSQHANVKVHVIAERLVEQASSTPADGTGGATITFAQPS